MARYLKMNKVGDLFESGIKGELKPMAAHHVKSCYKLVTDYLKQFKLYQEFSKKEF
jgi:hypothetical protein